MDILKGHKSPYSTAVLGLINSEIDKIEPYFLKNKKNKFKSLYEVVEKSIESVNGTNFSFAADEISVKNATQIYMNTFAHEIDKMHKNAFGKVKVASKEFAETAKIIEETTAKTESYVVDVSPKGQNKAVKDSYSTEHNMGFVSSESLKDDLLKSEKLVNTNNLIEPKQMPRMFEKEVEEKLVKQEEPRKRTSIEDYVTVKETENFRKQSPDLEVSDTNKPFRFSEVNLFDKEDTKKAVQQESQKYYNKQPNDYQSLGEDVVKTSQTKEDPLDIYFDENLQKNVEDFANLQNTFKSRAVDKGSEIFNDFYNDKSSEKEVVFGTHFGSLDKFVDLSQDYMDEMLFSEEKILEEQKQLEKQIIKDFEDELKERPELFAKAGDEIELGAQNFDQFEEEFNRIIKPTHDKQKEDEGLTR